MPDENTKHYHIPNALRIGLGRGFRFEAGHILVGYDGKCATPHGHSYHGNVLVSAPRTHADAVGIVLDFDVLGRAIKDCIFTLYDHTQLTEAAEALVDRMATDLQAWFSTFGGRELAIQHEDKGLKMRRVPADVLVERVVLYETAMCYVVWRREGY